MGAPGVKGAVAETLPQAGSLARQTRADDIRYHVRTGHITRAIAQGPPLHNVSIA
jgi:hypothetical protein